MSTIFSVAETDDTKALILVHVGKTPGIRYRELLRLTGLTNGTRVGGAAAAHVSPIFIPHDILNVWILSVVLSLAAGLFPAWKASRLSPLEALRR
jgi:ABC-type lipoprotein release transport system permease subunit